jgi:uncharacterized membrane protein
MMKKGETNHVTCHVCGRTFSAHDSRPWVAVQPGVSRLIEDCHPGWVAGQYICLEDLNKIRRAYAERLLEEERGELGDIEREVATALAEHQIVTQNISETAIGRFTFGDQVADRVAAFGGSWTFILGFVAVLLVWITFNVFQLLTAPFDPYPFILLNLVLSMIAALEASIIMMSQRRQEERDRLRAENDYRVNPKAELKIRQLHEKIDHQLAHQWEKLTELQKIQIDLLEESARNRKGR